MPIEHSRTARTGVSLIEVVVAVFLFGFGCLAMLSTQTALTRLRSATLEHQMLAVLALNTLDSLRSAPCGSLVPGAVSRRPGRLALRTNRSSRVVEVQLTAAPSSGSPPWSADTIVPCVP